VCTLFGIVGTGKCRIQKCFLVNLEFSPRLDKKGLHTTHTVLPLCLPSPLTFAPLCSPRPAARAPVGGAPGSQEEKDQLFATGTTTTLRCSAAAWSRANPRNPTSLFCLFRHFAAKQCSSRAPRAPQKQALSWEPTQAPSNLTRQGPAVRTRHPLSTQEVKTVSQLLPSHTLARFSNS
jgi:hypothetical protein